MSDIDPNGAEFLSAIQSLFVPDDEMTFVDIKNLKKVVALYHFKQQQWAEIFDSLQESDVYFRDLADHYKDGLSKQKAIADQAMALLRLSVDMLQDQKPVRGKGRPSREKSRSFLLKTVTEYKALHGNGHKKKTGRKMSDRDALVGFFKEFYKREGMRESRVDSAEFQGKLKTYTNNITDARADLKRQERLLKLAVRKNPD